MNLANKITIFRILLIPFFIASIIYYKETLPYLRFLPVIIFTLASFTDAIDGGIARSRTQVTDLGIVLDPLADKLLILSAFISLSVVKTIPEDLRIPAWILLTVISRDIIIILGLSIIYILKGEIKIRPSWLGKATTFFQMFAIMVILATFRYNRYFIYPAICFTILSTIDYIWRGSRQLNDAA